jgi:hypothetical protein
MKAPALIDFGLSATDPARIEARIERVKRVVGWLCAALYLSAAIICWIVFGGQGLGIVAASVFPFGLILILVLVSVAGRLASPPRYREWKKAEQEYSEWFVRTQADFWLGLDGFSFENEVAHLFHRAGYSPSKQRATGDGGIDIVCGDGTIVQCKAHKKPIPPAVLRELYGTQLHFKAPKAVLVSRSGVTSAAQSFARGKNIEIWDLGDLIALQKHLGESVLAKS